MNIGIDIEEVKRFEYLLLKKPNLLRRFFSSEEWNYANQKAAVAQSLAGLWCAKEAVVKAFSEYHVVLVRDVFISHYENGAPIIKEIKGLIDFERYIIKISISHTTDFAVANCLIIKN